MTIRIDSGASIVAGPGGAVAWDPAIGVGDVFIARRAAADVLSKGTGISAALVVALQEIATFTNDVGTVEIGSTVNNVNFAWTYNRNADDPDSQDIDQGIPALADSDRAYAAAALGLVATTTFTLTSVGDDEDYGAPVGNPDSAQTTITFMAKVYFGVDQAVINTGAGIMAAFAGSGEFDANRQHTYNFDASGGGGDNYLYIAYPSSYGAPASTTFNGFAFNAYTSVLSNLTNASGHIQEYIILKTDNTYSGDGITWVIL